MERVIRAGWSLAFRFSNQVVRPKRGVVWIDAGAHLGERTFYVALSNPKLTVFAFEPNLRLISRRMGVIPNYVVIPMAIAEIGGSVAYYEYADDATNSTIPLTPEGLSNWRGDKDDLALIRISSVPSIRLDTFLDEVQLDSVDWLKIDTQGSDLSVIKSADKRIQDVRLVTAEVKSTKGELYLAEPHKAEMVQYMESNGFKIVREDTIGTDYIDLTFENLRSRT